MSERQQTERELRAQAQVNEIIEKVGPRAGTEVAQVLGLLTQAENAVVQCTQAAQAGVEPGTMRFTAELEAEKAEQFAAFIAKEWQRVCGEDNDQKPEQGNDQVKIDVKFYVSAGDEASAERAVADAIEQAKELPVTFTGVIAELEEGSLAGEEMFNVYATAIVDDPDVYREPKEDLYREAPDNGWVPQTGNVTEDSAEERVAAAGEMVASCGALIEEFSICD
jgi:hypothetical protein